MAYERKLDLMDESLFPIRPAYSQKENPNELSRILKPVEQTEEEIINFVSREMSGTMGPYSSV